jgi:hypothetical protein
MLVTEATSPWTGLSSVTHLLLTIMDAAAQSVQLLVRAL